jgi:hypothetical protein
VDYKTRRNTDLKDKACTAKYNKDIADYQPRSFVTSHQNGHVLRFEKREKGELERFGLRLTSYWSHGEYILTG